jgi:hypothetical protein
MASICVENANRTLGRICVVNRFRILAAVSERFTRLFSALRSDNGRINATGLTRWLEDASPRWGIDPFLSFSSS